MLHVCAYILDYGLCVYEITTIVLIASTLCKTYPAGANDQARRPNLSRIHNSCFVVATYPLLL